MATLATVADEDPLDVHIPTGRAQRLRRPTAPARSRSSRSFYKALHSIDLSDRGPSTSTIHQKDIPRVPLRRISSMSKLDPDVSPDNATCKALFQRIMHEGLDVGGDDRKPEKGSSSFHIESSTGPPFHTTSMDKTPTLDLGDLLPQTSPAEKEKNGQVVPLPTLPMLASNAKTKATRSVQKIVEEKFVEEVKLEHNTSCVPMQVTNLLWIHSGVSGSYSGQINCWIQPHGYGSLSLSDGTTITSKWCNGTPLDTTPCDRRRSDGEMLNRVSHRRDNNPRNRRRSEISHKHRATLDESARTNSGKGSVFQKMSSEPIPSNPRHMYQLGDKPKSSSHMIHAPSVQNAIENAESLKIHDFAFVKRSNGEWCYCIVAKKNIAEDRGRSVEDCEDASILFVTDTNGNTKCIKMKHWGKMIRLVNV